MLVPFRPSLPSLNTEAFFFKAGFIQVLLCAMQNCVGRPSDPEGSSLADLTAVSQLLGGGDGAEPGHPVQKQSRVCNFALAV